jgi:(1->4)-alpha-D-glucan 1-alpha-D-glucosylmutase
MRDPLDVLLEQTWNLVAARRAQPESVYRLQFRQEFTFADAAALTPYLAKLGITHIYASPYFKARAGSPHGYDIVDHRQINPELGTEEDRQHWVNTLRQNGMGHILDFVPNHMGIGNDNVWWQDVLENGPASPYAGFFDIDWFSPTRPELRGKVLLPVLGAPYGDVLESRQFTLEYHQGAFTLRYFDHRFPIAPQSYAKILGHRLDELEKMCAPDDPAWLEWQSILTAIQHLPDRLETDSRRIAEGLREKEIIKRRLAALTENHPTIQKHLDAVVADFNGVAGDARSFDRLDELLEQQAYRLSFWRVASDEINYRRFFDVNDLAAISTERDEVFETTHQMVFQWLAEGSIDGLRIDHVDGLYAPRQYLERLQQGYLMAVARRLRESEPLFRELDWASLEGPVRERLSDLLRDNRSRSEPPPLYVVVEKILGNDERLSTDWAAFGTTGYEFLSHVNSFFVAPTRDRLTQIYHEFLDDDPRFPEVAYQSKRLVLQSLMASELQMLAHQLDRLAQKHRWSRDFTRNTLRHVLREVIANFPVYRTYIEDDGVTETDRRTMMRAIRAARQRNPATSAALFEFVRCTLLQDPIHPNATEGEYKTEQRRFIGKFQQLTSPVVAKGIEDTAFYRFNRLLSLNEVGGDPDRFGITPTELHRFFAERQRTWPWALSTLATHDTKRGEDLRARLHVISEIPDEWRDSVFRWREWNRPHRLALDETEVPDPNEEYFLYQTLVGAWPIEDFDETNRYRSPVAAAEFLHSSFLPRIQEYMSKALNEAKVHSSWIRPDPEHDAVMRHFIARILDAEKSPEFFTDIRAFAQRLSHWGCFLSLAQTVLKLTATGVPDLYQGTELWDFSLVDPDNRRLVDYDRRRKLLDEFLTRSSDDTLTLCRDLVARKEDGRLKLYVIWRCLQARRSRPGLFTLGDYYPLEVEGTYSQHAFAFGRRRESSEAIVVVPRWLVRLIHPPLPPTGAVWEDTRLTRPDTPESALWIDLFTGRIRQGGSWLLSELFADFPVAVLLSLPSEDQSEKP